MFVLLRLLGFRRLAVLFVLRMAWRMFQARRRAGERARARLRVNPSA